MKLCILSQNLYTMGGLQRVVTSALNHLVKDPSWEITVLMPDDQVEKKIFRLDERIRVVDSRKLRKRQVHPASKVILAANKRSGFFDLAFAPRIIADLFFLKEDREAYLRFLKAEGFDVVMGANQINSCLLGCIAGELDCKTVGWQHSTFDGYFRTWGVNHYGLRKFSGWCYRRLDQVWVLTQADKEKFDSQFGISSRVFHNPVEPPVCSDAIKREKDILFVGRINKMPKGVDYLADLIQKIYVKYPDWHFTVVGKGDALPWLEKHLKNQGLSQVVNLVGATDNTAPYYQRASICVQTSRYEGFGMTLVEAMSAGVPCVAFHNLGPDEIITDGVEGFLVPKFDMECFADKVGQLIENGSLWSSMSNAAKKRAADFRIEDFVEKMKKNLEG